MGYHSELVIEFEKLRKEEFLEQLLIVNPSWHETFTNAEHTDETDTCILYHWECIKAYEVDHVFELLEKLKIPYYSIRLGDEDNDNEVRGDYNMDTFGVGWYRSIQWEGQDH